MPSPFHRSSSFQFPRGPPSPPDTNTDTIVPGMTVPMVSSNLSISGPDLSAIDNGLAYSSPDFPGTRMKKSSSLPYHLSGLRDVKDRPSSAPPKGPRSLIVVIPPSSLFTEKTPAHTHNGSQIGSQSHRLSQGVIMPLFPSLFGQLTAIAREFNFPSTSGISLYFHYRDGQVSSVPRITDESWPILCSHLTDQSFANERRPLISGKVDFDVDHRLARWFGPWLSSFIKETSDSSTPYPHTAPFSHFRGESRTTTDGRYFDDESGEGSAIQQHSAPVRHGPRKLSLVERFESPVSRQDVRPVPLSLGTPPDQVPATSQALSPIRQEEEPKSARQDLNSRVKSWRASAQLSPSPLALTGQISLEPPNLPNTMVLNSDSDSDAKSLRMEDFQWSISSAGPQSEGVSPSSPWFYPPSVHLDSRLVGSVCSTPSIQTSWGPSDYDSLSPGPAQYARALSPDIANRFFENGIDSPLTTTSWGAPLSYPPSPLLLSRLPSPDIAYRCFEDAPDTPVTATSWGAPLSYPPSPLCLSPVPSLDLGERAAFDDLDFPVLNYSYPYATTSSSKPWVHVWPYTAHIHPSTDSGPDSAAQSQEMMTWRQVWPYNSKSTDLTTKKPADQQYVEWRQVWPYNSHSIGPDMQSCPISLHHQSFVYPFTSIYRPVYPYFDIYPAVHKLELSVKSRIEKPRQEARGEADDMYPGNLYSLYPVVRREIELEYPYNLQNIYPTVRREVKDEYPHNLQNIYATVHQVIQSYDNIPHNLSNIYPPVFERMGAHGRTYGHESDSARFVGKHADSISIYPYLNIYPSVRGPSFAHFSLYMYGPKLQYPHFEIYPSSGTDTTREMTIVKKIVGNVKLSSWPGYPTFNLYPAVYPFFDLYPSVNVSDDASTKASSGTVANRLRLWANTDFNFCSVVYPHFDLYPARSNEVIHINNDTQVQTLAIGSSYPYFNLYPGIYPYLKIYPEAYTLSFDKAETKIAIHRMDMDYLKPTLSSSYPSFNLYPAVYPHMVIYPAPYGLVEPTPSSDEDVLRTVETPRATYPSFVLYRSVYPYFDLYPAISHVFPPITKTFLRPIPVHPSFQYPTINLYDAVYPNFDLYPSLNLDVSPPVTAPSKPSSRLTHAELHAMVMMEKFGHVGSFGLVERGSSPFANETRTVTRTAYLGNTMEEEPNPADIRLNTYTTSFPSVVTRRDSTASRSEANKVSQDIRDGLQRPVDTWKLARSRSLRQEPEIPLPPRPMSMAQTREPTRSVSMRDRVHSLSPAVGLPPRPAVRKRDSLVLQRVRAYDNNGESDFLSFLNLSDNNEPVADAVTSTKDTLSKFPMPPKFPLPPLPMTSKDNSNP